MEREAATVRLGGVSPILLISEWPDSLTLRNEGKIDRIKRGKIDRKINIRKRNK